jgi:hypothetical protein
MSAIIIIIFNGEYYEKRDKILIIIYNYITIEIIKVVVVVMTIVIIKGLE